MEWIQLLRSYRTEEFYFAVGIRVSGTGKVVTVRDVVDMWRKQEDESITKEGNDLEYYTRQISFYEEKYGGEFEQTLGTQSELTSEEETDAQVWQHLLGRQRLEFKDSEK